jgi:deoxyadenosine/deoxycytidine kinase
LTSDIREWQVTVAHRITSIAPVLSICGPSGAGKTTVVEALADEFQVFIETTKGNPHLAALLNGKVDFNAAANQKWFLNLIGKGVAQADPKFPLILDQDPAAIVFAYAKMFLEDRRMTETQYEYLLKKLSKIEETLQRWTSPRIVLLLDASPPVLYHRILRRSGKAKTPPLEWFGRVRDQFARIFPHFPNAFTISTERHTAEQVAKRARTLIERKINEGHV